MPAQSPRLAEPLSHRLTALGEQIRAHRRRQKIGAAAAAEAAGMSRVTLHRIERGEPSVTMGAYLSALDALGLVLQLQGPPPGSPPRPDAASDRAPPNLPARIRLADHPQLKRLAWHLQGVETLSPAEALSLYERNWRHIEPAALTPNERALVQRLTDELAGGRLLV